MVPLRSIALSCAILACFGAFYKDSYALGAATDGGFVSANVGNVLAGFPDIILEQANKVLGKGEKILSESKLLEKKLMSQIAAQEKNLKRAAEGTNAHIKAIKKLNGLQYQLSGVRQLIGETQLRNEQLARSISVGTNALGFKFDPLNKLFKIDSKASPNIGAVTAGISAIFTAIDEYALSKDIGRYNSEFGLDLDRSVYEIGVQGVSDFFKGATFGLLATINGTYDRHDMPPLGDAKAMVSWFKDMEKWAAIEDYSGESYTPPAGLLYYLKLKHEYFESFDESFLSDDERNLKSRISFVVGWNIEAQHGTPSWAMPLVREVDRSGVAERFGDDSYAGIPYAWEPPRDISDVLKRGLVSLPPTAIDSYKSISDAIDNKMVDATRTIEATRKLELGRQLSRFDVDIFFLADNTGSMGGLIGSAKTNAQAILDALRADTRFSKVNAQFGVGMFLGDPSESGETATSAYQLLQPITNNDAQITTAINQWYASGGGDWEEANFYAIHQVITQGAAVPRNATLKSDQVTGWRPGAAKVIVVFGDAPSWQNSVNEKELKELARTTGARIVFIDTSEINYGQQSNVYAASSGQQMQDAALEIADASGGSYMHLSDVSKIKDAVLDSVYDAIAENKWGGGMLARIDAGTKWRTRTPSSVTAESKDGGKVLVFTLRYPNQADAVFSIDTSTAGKVAGHEYYQGSVSGANSIFGKGMGVDSVFHTNAAQDFFRFVLRGEGGIVEGYYGERLNSVSKMPSSGVSTYDLRHRVISPYDNNAYAAGGMKLFVNWASGKVYGFEENASLAGGAGTALFIGDVDRSGLEIEGQYVFKTRRLTMTESSSIPRFIRDAMRETTSLQFYGGSYPNGIGGVFGSAFYNESGSPTISSMLMSGYVNEKNAASAYAPANNEVWKGYAVGFVANRSSGAVSIAYNTNPEDLEMTLRPTSGAVKADITVRDGGAAYSFASDWSDSSVFVNKDAFAVIKEVNSVPSYAATTMTEDDGYNYLSWGAWSTELVATPNTSVMDGSHWIAGTLTPTTSMPTTGTATYTGQVRGTAHEGGALHALNGSTNLTANFGTGNISGQMNIRYANTGAAYATSHMSGVTISGNRFGGSLSGADNAGVIQGGFFGPAAQEVGGNWAIEKTSGSKAAGVFSGKR